MKCAVFGIGLATIAVSTIARAAPAQETPSTEKNVTVAVHDPAGEDRRIVLEWNPLSLITIARVSFNVILMPAEHHALVLSPQFAWASTAPIYIFNAEGVPRQVPEQKFESLGGEIGYRYYAGTNGPRGWFVGPSLLAGAVWAKPRVGATQTFADLGLAVDAGYQVLLGDRLSIGLGAGVQYLFTTTHIPDQQFPAHIIANREFNPRVLLSLGWAF